MVSNSPNINLPMDIRDSTAYEVQEKGEIYFFYKPKAGVDHPKTEEDVQRLYIVLRPEEAEKRVEEKQSSDSGKEGKFRAKEEEESHRSPKSGVKAAMEVERNLEVHSVVTEDLHDYTVHGGQKVTDEHGHKKFMPYQTVSAGGHGTERVEIGKKPLFRYLVMGRKHLPLPKHTSPFWGFVELVTTKPADIIKVLNDGNAESDTVQSEQAGPGARPVGEGVYSLVRHHTAVRTSTHLVYKLENPGPHKKDDDPRDALNIEPQASFVIQIKNPEQATPVSSNGVGSKRRAFLPAHLQGRIGSRRFLPADPPDLLNYEGVEFILVSAHDDVDAELGSDLSFHNHDPLTLDPSDELIQYLVAGAKHHKHLIRPLIEGQWA